MLLSIDKSYKWSNLFCGCEVSNGELRLCVDDEKHRNITEQAVEQAYRWWLATKDLPQSHARHRRAYKQSPQAVTPPTRALVYTPPVVQTSPSWMGEMRLRRMNQEEENIPAQLSEWKAWAGVITVLIVVISFVLYNNGMF